MKVWKRRKQRNCCVWRREMFLCHGMTSSNKTRPIEIQNILSLFCFIVSLSDIRTNMEDVLCDSSTRLLTLWIWNIFQSSRNSCRQKVGGKCCLKQLYIIENPIFNRRLTFLHVRCDSSHNKWNSATDCIFTAITKGEECEPRSWQLNRSTRNWSRQLKSVEQRMDKWEEEEVGGRGGQGGRNRGEVWCRWVKTKIKVKTFNNSYLCLSWNIIIPRLVLNFLTFSFFGHNYF